MKRTAFGSLVGLFAVLAIGVALCASAVAAPRLIAKSSTYVENVAVDGDFAYWAGSDTLHRIDLTTGTDTVVYDTRKRSSILELAAGGGRVAIRTSASRGFTTIETIFAGSTSATSLQSVAKASNRFYETGTCGQSLSLGNVTDAGSVIYISSSERRAHHNCRGKLMTSATVFAADAPADPSFPPPPRALANSSLRFPTDPELRGDSLLIQNGQKYVVRSLSSGVSVTNKAPRYMIAVASFDPFANLLVDQFKPEAGARRVWIASAASNYVTQSPLTTKPDFTSYLTCGNQLLKLRFGKVSSIDLLANPFAPATSTPRSVLPLTTAEVGAAGCNDTRVAFTTYPRKGSLVYIDDLAG